MRSVHLIKTELLQEERAWLAKRSELMQEIADFQDKCPHTEGFVTQKLEDSFDECGGPGIYEETWVTYSCALCEGKWSARYNKKDQARRPNAFSDAPPPTLQEILKDI